MSFQDLRTISFYQYKNISEPHSLREELFSTWSALGIIGRIYVSSEGINAQLSVPNENFADFQNHVHSIFPKVPFKVALEESALPFKKLIIKVREKIVADGLNDETFDVTDVGRHLSADEFDHALEQDETIVVDMRNHYECEVGHFKKAYLPKAQTFREALPEVEEYLHGQEDKKILLYCTGGIRCEKASAYFKHKGFKDVNQLHGGIIDYARQINEEQRQSNFIGKNFVFDDRLGESVTDDVISNCHQCGNSCNTHTNCQNPGCNLLFIQCGSCKDDIGNYCSYQCRDIVQLPREEQIKIQQRQDEKGYKFYRSRQKHDLMRIAAEYREAQTRSQDLVPPSLPQ
ncbi:rhodanese-related sulfurtransferase [Pseudobacteriovorax antillogorgiicola]|uniref:tRNA uridine(34) hydroxylase n=1 Tax=Pseudobacteriovorax antillogorgiicola TaxID=1513793 RepID=A0A1Y6C4E4_9BACT|nr:rhodanese-related sulfurtransferase [Pseudobacteriovorax antillogorgiicola]TCS51249.1 UPF0176 protein [Pseudobacteriovorax antillogorgiicola]SMF36519.1 UPF0176 protein [Pseudobacteriovorax antillogorgiicola]